MHIGVDLETHLVYFETYAQNALLHFFVITWMQSKFMRITIPLFLLLLLLLFTPQVFAQDGSSVLGAAQLTNRATVQSSCSIATVSNIVFGGFDPLNVTFRTATGSLRVHCTQGSYSISRNMGTNAFNYSKSSKYTNTNGTSSGQLYEVSLVCSSAMRGPNAKLLEYRIGARPSYNEMRWGTGNAQWMDNRTCLSTDQVVHATPTFTTNEAQTIDVTASIGSSGDKTIYKELRQGSYTDTLTFTITF